MAKPVGFTVRAADNGAYLDTLTANPLPAAGDVLELAQDWLVVRRHYSGGLYGRPGEWTLYVRAYTETE